MFVADPRESARALRRPLPDRLRQERRRVRGDRSFIREGWNYSSTGASCSATCSRSASAASVERPHRPGPVGGSPTFVAQPFEPDAGGPTSRSSAFDDADRYDSFWATKIIVRFTREQIRAVVELRSSPIRSAAAYLTDTLVARQRDDRTGSRGSTRSMGSRPRGEACALRTSRSTTSSRPRVARTTSCRATTRPVVRWRGRPCLRRRAARRARAT